MSLKKWQRRRVLFDTNYSGTDRRMAYINVQHGFGKEGRVFEYSNGLIRKEKGQSKGFGFTLLRIPHVLFFDKGGIWKIQDSRFLRTR